MAHFINRPLLECLPMTDRQTIPAGATDDLAPRAITPRRVPVTAAWLAEQTRKRAAYDAQREAWHRMLEHRAQGMEPPPVIVCRCGKCGRRLRDGGQLRLPF